MLACTYCGLILILMCTVKCNTLTGPGVGCSVSGQGGALVFCSQHTHTHWHGRTRRQEFVEVTHEFTQTLVWSDAHHESSGARAATEVMCASSYANARERVWILAARASCCLLSLTQWKIGWSGRARDRSASSSNQSVSFLLTAEEAG